MMKKDIKRRWIKALLSGKYKQARGALNDSQGFCCLGVLCDLYAKEKKLKNPWPGEKGSEKPFSTTGEYGTLPKIVRKWAGLSDSDPDVEDKKTGKSDVLSNWNDAEKASFRKIARLIETNL